MRIWGLPNAAREGNTGSLFVDNLMNVIYLSE